MVNRVETATTPTSRATTEARRGKHAGFTLIELVVVITIIAIAAAIAIPSIGAGAHQREVRRTLQKFVSTLRRASSVAVFQRRPVELRVFPKERRYVVVLPKLRSEEDAAATKEAERSRSRSVGLVGRGKNAVEEEPTEAGVHTVELPEMASFGDIEGGRDLPDEGIVFDFLPNGSSSGGMIELLFDSGRGRPESFRRVVNPLISAVSFEDEG